MADLLIYDARVGRPDLLFRLGGIAIFWLSWRTAFVPWKRVAVMEPDWPEVAVWRLCGCFALMRWVRVYSYPLDQPVPAEERQHG